MTPIIDDGDDSAHDVECPCSISACTRRCSAPHMASAMAANVAPSAGCTSHLTKTAHAHVPFKVVWAEDIFPFIKYDFNSLLFEFPKRLQEAYYVKHEKREKENPAKRRKSEIDTATTDAFHKAGLDSRVQERLEEVVREV